MRERMVALGATVVLGCLLGGCPMMNTDGQANNNANANDNTNNNGTPNPSGEDPATFQVQGTTATMIGTIDGTTPAAVQQLIANNPQVTMIILQNVPGSADDDANLQASRMVRQAGLDTHIPAGPGVASGGTDFFLAGVNRTMDAGAIVGVHAWQDENGSGKTQKDANPNWATSPEHQSYLQYYTEMGIADPNGFYCYTLDAAPPVDIYNMNAAEKNQWGMCAPNPCP